MTSFLEFFLGRIEHGGFTTEDVLTSVLPLVRQTVVAHAAGLVAPLEGLDDLQVDGVRILFDEARRISPTLQNKTVNTLEQAENRALEIIGESRVTMEISAAQANVTNLQVGQRGETVTRPVYLPGYISWEHELGHHDPLTDIYCLGLVLATLACGLDLTVPENVVLFVKHRHSLFDLNRDLHPVLAKTVVRMTELDRRKRPQDLAALLGTLENYRDQNIDFEYEVARTAGFRETDLGGKRRTVLSTLQRRLFEITKRNRLLHFRQTMQTVNLTVSSVPLSFDVNSLRPEQILTWNDELHGKVVEGKSLSLNSCLRFEEAVYLPGLLDRIRSEAQRDQVEYGFAQLRLVLCFLRWSNLKEKPPERFDSPLVLLPVQLVKKKGVRDTYSLETLSTDAEINPVLRYYFKQLYDISLPEALDLTTTSLDAFHEFLAAKVQLSEPAITVTKIARPRIQLIHAKAQRRLDQYIQRTRLSGRGIRSFHDLDYSYDKDNFHPLGLRLFRTKIQHTPTNLQSVIQNAPRRRTFVISEGSAAPPEAEQERTLYSLNEPEESNPYLWEYDLCSVTLGNFRYRRFSLVRDYAALLEKDPNHPVFDAIFSLAPRAVELPLAEPPLEDRYPVLTCDPTQASAISRARAGKSYIIQGPPGTGKSQTIANLIADYVSRGQRVLFVCEKRAAIDVVYHRLQQNGLQLLCSLIHDSQEDKKEFIMDLKRTYESFMESAGKKVPSAERLRTQLLESLQCELKPLQDFYDAMRSPAAGSSVPLRQMLQRLVALRDNTPELSPVDKERMPGYAQWCEHHERIERLAAALEDLHGDPCLAHHPLRHLGTRLAGVDRPVERVTANVRNIDSLVVRLQTAFEAIGLLPEEFNSSERAAQVVRYAEQMRCLAEKSIFPLLISDSAQSKKLVALVKEYRKKIKTLEEAQVATTGWRKKLAPAEVPTALEQARELEGSLFAFLKPAWWRLRALLERAYDFHAHQLKPTWTQVLEKLELEYHVQAEADAVEMKAQEAFEWHEPLSSLLAKVQELREVSAQAPVSIRDLQHRLLMKGEADQALVRVAELKPDVEQLNAEIGASLDGCQDRPFPELLQILDQIEARLDDLPDFLFCLTEAAGLSPELLAVLRGLPLTRTELEAAMAQRTWEEVCRVDRNLNRFTDRVRSRQVRKVSEIIEKLYEANAAVLCERVRLRFLEHVRVSGLSHAELIAEEKEFKAVFNRGRRELEHEFGKVMRYRSIRELVTGDAGSIIKDLKPVWLMSPLSASDTLPLDADHFDVVIFDEASQITLEGAVPSLFRASQAIVVGDQMQLPPTNFFSTKQLEDPEGLAVVEPDAGGETGEHDLESNSFLAYAARVLPSTMLGWHYRSRSESLISFSNAAFYQGRLLTVPDKMLPGANWSEIQVTSAEQGADNLSHLLERPISYHFVGNGVYVNRQNTAEADYIANLVRALLSSKTDASIGIIAFSEAQQGEILDALTRLGEEDEKFRDRLEAEVEREEKGQFVGLLVKNLENIQGDERDIIILSVCYSRGPSGKMLMNFGPINQSGGEKRLNVAFSRAKQHMAVVSSIHHPEITNDYNEGARCLKNYLRYTAAASSGDTETARRVLHELLRPEDTATVPEVDIDLVVDQLTGTLREHGYEVDLEVGQSSFRCDLAVRLPGEREYRAGILVDTPAYYGQPDLLEREVMRPKLLEAFGWRIAHVLAKDWYTDPANTLAALIRFVENKEKADDEGDEVKSVPKR
ncbi:MAG TPA: AAA domain-containing protein [Gemmataceae bacterium]|nr:AAA domain-containing protein [Gemmataceae bacterium]